MGSLVRKPPKLSKEASECFRERATRIEEEWRKESHTITKGNTENDQNNEWCMCCENEYKVTTINVKGYSWEVCEDCSFLVLENEK